MDANRQGQGRMENSCESAVSVIVRRVTLKRRLKDER